jgi:hypothetical protein
MSVPEENAEGYRLGSVVERVQTFPDECVTYNVPAPLLWPLTLSSRSQHPTFFQCAGRIG